jgi:hypothetical protein
MTWWTGNKLDRIATEALRPFGGYPDVRFPSQAVGDHTTSDKPLCRVSGLSI